MDFKVVKKEEICGIHKERYGKVGALVSAFEESGAEAAEIKWNGEYRSAQNAYNSIWQCIRRRNFITMVIRRGDRLFLVRKEENNE